MGLHQPEDSGMPSNAEEVDEGQRTAPRFALMLRAGKLVGDSCEFLCVLRDVSASGLRVRLFHPLPELEQFEVELMGGERYTLIPVWEEGSHAGFRFAEGTVDIDKLLAEVNSQSRRRQVRLQLGLPALIVAEGVTFAAHLDNLSQHGARIECDAFLALGQRVRLEVQGMPSRTAKISWRREGAYGLVLEETFRLEELAHLNERLQLERHKPAMQARLRARP